MNDREVFQTVCVVGLFKIKNNNRLTIHYSRLFLFVQSNLIVVKFTYKTQSHQVDIAILVKLDCLTRITVLIYKHQYYYDVNMKVC